MKKLIYLILFIVLITPITAENNIFMLKDNKIIKSLSVKNIEIDYPYHLCIEPENKKTKFIMEGKGEKIRLYPSCEAKECNDFVPENLDLNSDNKADDKDIEEYTSQNWYNNRPHTALNWEELKTPLQEFERKIKK